MVAPITGCKLRTYDILRGRQIRIVRPLTMNINARRIFFFFARNHKIIIEPRRRFYRTLGPDERKRTVLSFRFVRVYSVTILFYRSLGHR